jgi:hypothetical protein
VNAENSKGFLAEAITTPSSSHAKMTPPKEAMDVHLSTSKPSTSSDLMKLIDDANRVRKWNSGQSEAGRKAWQCSIRTVAGVATAALRTPSEPARTRA